MTNVILILALNIGIFWLIGAVQKALAKQERSEKARVNALKRYRWSDGKFAKKATYADMARAIANKPEEKKERLIPVHYGGEVVEYISL